MRTVLVIGMGAGDPDYMTAQAVAGLNAADVLFVLEKADEQQDLIALRREICDRFVDGEGPRVVAAQDPPRRRGTTAAQQRAAVADWRRLRAELCERLIDAELGAGGTGAFLVWGDPSLYDGLLDVLGQIAGRDAVTFELKVIPGISAPAALAARHRIALNRPGGAVHLTTGRRLARGFPAEADDVVVMLDGDLAFKQVEGDHLEIFWGAYLGTPDEVLIAGPLREVEDEIERVRAAARERKGWMFDTYLLRRRPA
ncbi:MAG: precorrin-6A synthase (deacetylating) [Solirubrobacteraceae bacterium]